MVRGCSNLRETGNEKLEGIAGFSTYGMEFERLERRERPIPVLRREPPGWRT